MERKIIHAHVFNPKGGIFKTSKREKAETRVITCFKSEKCDFYKNGKCLERTLNDASCEWGSHSLSEVGPSIMSKKFYSWIEEKEELYKEFIGKGLKTPNYGIYNIDDETIFYFSFINFERYGDVNTSILKIKTSEIKAETLIKYLKSKKYSLFGGEISDYRLEVVPFILEQIEIKFPDLYKEIIKIEPTLKLEKRNPVGRRAKLVTLKDGCTLGKKREWEWKNGVLTNEKDSSGWGTPCSLGEVESKIIKVIPKKEAVFEVEDESQVDENTVFLN